MGVIEESHAVFLYADDVCLMTSNEHHLQAFGGCEICEVEEYKYLGVTAKPGWKVVLRVWAQNGGCKWNTWYGKICICKVGKNT